MYHGTTIQPRRQRNASRTLSTASVGATLLLAVLLVGSLAFLLLSGVSPYEDGGPFVTGDRPVVHQKLADGSLGLGQWQTMMVEMLNRELPFTVFVPSETTLSQILKYTIQAASDPDLDGRTPPQLNSTRLAVAEQDSVSVKGSRKSLRDSAQASGLLSTGERESTAADEVKSEAVAAVVSRLLAFSAIPSRILAATTPTGSETVWESISGYIVYVASDHQRRLVANNLSCLVSDIFRGSNVIHVVDGALMDSEFEQAVSMDSEEEP